MHVLFQTCSHEIVTKYANKERLGSNMIGSVFSLLGQRAL